MAPVNSIPLRSTRRRKAAYTVGSIATKSGITPLQSASPLRAAALDWDANAGYFATAQANSIRPAKAAHFCASAGLPAGGHAKQQKNSERAMHPNSRAETA
jgi:hypothetical protein